MDVAEFTRAMSGTPLATELRDQQIEALARIAHWKSCPSGTVLFREGDRHDGFYWVHKGHIGLEMCITGRGCNRILSIGPGEILAWSSLVGDGRMTATAIAQDDVELIEVSGAELKSICDADHEFGYYLMRRLASVLSQRLLATRLQLLDLFHADAPTGRGVNS